MQNVFFVKPDQFEIARAMEKKLLELPPDSGILFVGVTIHQNKDERKDLPEFRIIVGCSRERELELMVLVARQFLRDFVEEDEQLSIQAFRGVSRNFEN